MIRSLLPPMRCAFEATARLGGVGRAAQDLHVTHGAVSRQLKLLEDHLGLALFQRAGRGLRLTLRARACRQRAARPSPGSKAACASCGAAASQHWYWAAAAAYWHAG